MYIKREDALKELQLDHKDVIYIDKNECARRIKAIPSADRPQGKWAHQRNAFGIMEHKCSVCGVSFTTMDTYNFKYCFNCGARMKGADDEH